MSRNTFIPVIATMAAMLSGHACSEQKDAPVTKDTGKCNPPDPASSAWMGQPLLARPHVIDGQFGDGEWDGVIPLEGVLTDVYLAYQAPYLYVLNDWRGNVEGIDPECYNEFRLKVGLERVVLRVFGDGRVTVDGGELEAKGAYAFSASPRWSMPHTIYEFRVAVPGTGTISVCAMDPVNALNCEQLVNEPVVFAISYSAGATSVAREPEESVAELVEGATCGRGEGICRQGLSCVQESGTAICVLQTPPEGSDEDGEDAGPADASSDDGLDGPGMEPPL